MIERVARAICVARAGAENAAVSEFKAGNLWAEAKRDAHAAIGAMWEPTEKMLDAAEFIDDGRGSDIGWANAKKAWQAMITAAKDVE